jgi:hypothetical protein
MSVVEEQRLDDLICEVHQAVRTTIAVVARGGTAAEARRYLIEALASIVERARRK